MEDFTIVLDNLDSADLDYMSKINKDLEDAKNALSIFMAYVVHKYKLEVGDSVLVDGTINRVGPTT